MASSKSPQHDFIVPRTLTAVCITVCMRLQAWKLEQEQLKEEEMAKKSKKDNTPKGKQQKEDAKSTDKKGQKTAASGKKSRAETAVSSAKTPTESITTAAPHVEDNKDLHQTEVPFNVRAHRQNH